MVVNRGNLEGISYVPETNKTYYNRRMYQVAVYVFTVRELYESETGLRFLEEIQI